MSKRPSTRKQGVAIAKQVAKQLPPKAKSSFWSSVKKAAAMGSSAYRVGKKIYRVANQFGDRYIVPVNDFIHDRLWTPFWNGFGYVANGALTAVGTLMGAALLRNAAPMYDHPIGPPNINENIMGINFNGHY